MKTPRQTARQHRQADHEPRGEPGSRPAIALDAMRLGQRERRSARTGPEAFTGVGGQKPAKKTRQNTVKDGNGRKNCRSHVHLRLRPMERARSYRYHTASRARERKGRHKGPKNHEAPRNLRQRTCERQEVIAGDGTSRRERHQSDERHVAPAKTRPPEPLRKHRSSSSSNAPTRESKGRVATPEHARPKHTVRFRTGVQGELGARPAKHRARVQHDLGRKESEGATGGYKGAGQIQSDKVPGAEKYWQGGRPALGPRLP